MTTLFLESTAADFTVSLETYIRNPRWLRVHSAKYPLSRVLEEDGQIRSKGAAILSIPAGEYTLTSVEKALAAAVYVGARPAWITSLRGEHKLHLIARAHHNKALRRLLGIPDKSARLDDADAFNCCDPNQLPH